MWTRRLPQATFKILAEETTPLGDTGLLSNIDSLERAGFKYETVAKSLPPPPGQRGDLSVLMPLEIPVKPRSDRKLVTAAKLGPEILDYDEGVLPRAGRQKGSECRAPSPSDGYMSVHSPDKRFMPTPNTNNINAWFKPLPPVMLWLKSQQSDLVHPLLTLLFPPFNGLKMLR